MKNTLLVMLFILIGGSLVAVINSSIIGGLWNEPQTWIGGVVPGSGDDVVIYGPVLINGESYSRDLSVAPGGSLMNDAVVSTWLYVSGNLANAGVISNNSSNQLIIWCEGHISNSGSFTNYYLYLAGAANQNLSDTGSFNPENIIDYNSESSVTLLTDLILYNTILNMSGANLVLNSATTCDLSMNGGILQNAYLMGGNGATLTMGGGCYLDYVSGSELVLQGTVIIGNMVGFQILHNYATVYNHPSGSYAIGVFERLNQHGNMMNNPDGNYLNLTLTGDLYVYGAMDFYLLNLAGPGTTDIFQAADAPPIGCQYINNGMFDSVFRLLSDLRTSGSHINLNGGTLNLDYAGAGHDLTLSGGSLTWAVIDGGENSVMELQGDCYLSNVSADLINLHGTASVMYEVSIAHLRNYGIIQNYTDTSYTLSVTERLDNYGLILDNPDGYQFYLNLTGDLYNYGTMANFVTTLAKQNLMNVYQSAAATPIACTHFQTTEYSGNVQMLSDLEFDGSVINLYGKTLFMYSGGSNYDLTVRGGYLQNGVLGTDGFSGLELSNGAYLDNLAIGDVILRGMVIISSNVSFDDLEVEGTVWNYPTYANSLVVNGNLVNHGILANHPEGNYLYLYCRGDLANYGSIQTHQTFIDGTVDQYLLLGPGGIISCAGGFLLVSEFGYAQWYFNGLLPDPNYFDYLYIDPTVLGVWQSSNGITYGRNVILGSGLPLFAPTNVVITRLGGELRITWDQVENAVFYNVYAASDPFGSYALLPDKVFDYDPSDGTVWFETAFSTPFKFFRISAVD